MTTIAASAPPTAVSSNAQASEGERLSDILLTLFTPITFGTTYLVTTELLPPDRPLLAALLRALPAGLLLLGITRQLPRGDWWWKAAVLGTLNFGAFFPLLFFAAYRLPGGLAATISAIQPLVVMGLSAGILQTRPTPLKIGAALAGVTGVGLMVLTASASLDPLGIGAQVLGTSMMGTAIVLAKKWGRPEGKSILALTGWQMTFGGLMLAPLALSVEGLPDSLSPTNLAGYGYLTLIGGALAYLVWFRGIERLAPTSIVFLGLANPMTATLAGLLVLGQTLSPWQILGFLVALTAMVASQINPRMLRPRSVSR
jgi:probable blue pigment (indigoidine) exporter